MPIVINDQTKVATVTESTSFIGRALDGTMKGAFASENLTAKEAQGAMMVSLVGGIALGSIYARKNVAALKKPTLGVFF